MKEKKRGFFRRFLGSIVLLLNLGAILWLALCAFAAQADPTTIKFIPLFSLSTPFAIVVNIAFIVAWVFFSQRKIRALLSIAVLTVCYKLILVVFAFNVGEHNDMDPAENRVKVMTWNVHGMGLFNEPQNDKDDKKIIEYIVKQDADILCLPEFNTPKTQIRTDNAEEIIKQGGYKDYRFQADNTLGRYTFLGTAIFSKYPIHNYKSNKLGAYIYLIQGDIEFAKGDTVRMFFVHLNTFGLSDHDRAYIDQIGTQETDLMTELRRSRSFLWKFNYAFARRAKEVKKAIRVISESPYPVMVCGDFNDLPGSYTYTRFTEALEDPFLEKGTGFGRTYNQILPTLRIDYVFYDPDMLKCIGYRSKYTSLSDHNPVVVNFEILKARQG